MISQLPLGFSLRDDATFDSFFSVNNIQVVNHLQNLVNGKSAESYIYLWGSGGSGRTHLLQAVCHAAPEQNLSAVYLSFCETIDYNILNGLENLDLVCLDDIDKIAGDKQLELAIFNLFNHLREANKKLIVVGNSPAAKLKIDLLDLRSRLTWGITYKVEPLSDEEKLAALKVRAEIRGMHLENTVGKFLLRRCQRDMPQLFSTLERLDRASLAEQRKLTIPFVKEVLGF